MMGFTRISDASEVGVPGGLLTGRCASSDVWNEARVRRFVGLHTIRKGGGPHEVCPELGLNKAQDAPEPNGW